MPDAPLCCVTVAGSMIMAEQANPFRLVDPDVDTFFENSADHRVPPYRLPARADAFPEESVPLRSEEHTSELQSHSDLVCRLLLEKKKKKKLMNKFHI